MLWDFQFFFFIFFCKHRKKCPHQRNPNLSRLESSMETPIRSVQSSSESLIFLQRRSMYNWWARRASTASGLFHDSSVGAGASTTGAATAGAETAGAETAGAETAGAATAGAATDGAATTGAATTAGAATTGAASTGAATTGAATAGVTVSCGQSQASNGSACADEPACADVPASKPRAA